MLIYTVRPNETLAEIARRYGQTPERLVDLNDLPAADVVPGLSLVIPTRQHTLQPGETPYDIARRSGLPLQRLTSLNRIRRPEEIKPGRRLSLPPPAQVPAEGLGYLPLMDPGVTAAAVTPWADALSQVGNFSYVIDADGHLAPLADAAAIAAIKARKLRPVLVIANIRPGGAFDRAVAHAVLTSDEKRRRIVAAVQDTVRSKGYEGVDVDIENIAAADRWALPVLLRELRAALQPMGTLLSVAVPPKFDEETLTYAAGFDYAAIGQVVDQVYLMNYDFHWVGGPPGPLAPLPQVTRVVQYATARIPKEKVLLGITTSAYDWPLPDTPENRARAMPARAAVALALRHDARIRWNEHAASPWFRYTDASGRSHEVWFEDARSLAEKLQLVRDSGLRGFGFWQLAAPAPGAVALADSLFRMRR